MIGEAAVRRTIAYCEQVLAHTVSEAGPFSGAVGAADDADIGPRKLGARGVLVRRLACAEAPARGSA
jgi:hypothetical protein